MSTDKDMQNLKEQFEKLPQEKKDEARATVAALDQVAEIERKAAHERRMAQADRDCRYAARQLRSFYSADETRQLLANISAEVCV